MKRYVSIWFPNLLTDWMAIKNPELKDTTYVFIAPKAGKIMITAVSKKAEMQGILPNTPLADAKALIPDIKTFDDQPGLTEKLLIKIGKWCIRFAPFVAIDAPNGLILNSSGCAHLWGKEENYLNTILQRLQESGYCCRAAFSDTIGTSWAVARYGTSSPIIKVNEQYNALLNLPPAALRLDEVTILKLHKLGLNKIGKFIQMPRSVLRRRFGEAFLLKLGQALGTEEEVIKPLIITPPYQERLPCLEPIRTRSAIEIAIQKLLEMLCFRLANEGMGLRFATLKGYRIDGKTTQIQIGTNQATHQTNHLFKLFELKISTIAPALGIELFTLTANKVEAVNIHQESLWNNKPGLKDKSLAHLLDKLAGKIGAQAIRRYLPDAHHWPERSLRPALSLNEQSESYWQSTNPRPIELLSKPERVQVTAPIPDYPPMNFRYKDELHIIQKADGPERIEREWWMEKGEHRDYYVLEDEKGQRYWVFRSGHYHEDKSTWYLHGFFA
ncbi:MAG: DNA polymerase Y family protein [Pedobacter sp.]|nr:MAG: DNA polymerase Y family protein [Pedobacter sp.]